jgi:hypothetical protein
MTGWARNGELVRGTKRISGFRRIASGSPGKIRSLIISKTAKLCILHFMQNAAAGFYTKYSPVYFDLNNTKYIFARLNSIFTVTVLQYLIKIP